MFLGVMIYWQHTWSPHVSYLNSKLMSFINLVRFISGTRWGATVASLLRLHEALFVGLLGYIIHLLCVTRKTNVKTLQSIQGQALRACQGLPRTATTNGTIGEAGQLPIAALQEQEVLRSHLRHRTQHAGHHLANFLWDRNVSFVRVLSKHQRHIPNIFTQWKVSTTPPWKLIIPQIFVDIPGIIKKVSLPDIQLR